MARKTNSNPRGLMTVLIARFSAIGDVAMTVPVVYSLCRCYPDIRFVLATRPSMTSIFVNAPENLIVVGADVKDTYKGPAGMARLAAEIDKKYRIDAFADLHGVIRTRLMAFFLKLKGVPTVRIDKGRGDKRALTRRRAKVMLPLPSQRARYRAVFHRLGLPVTERFDGLYSGRSKADPVLFAKITGPKPQGERWIGIAPFAAHKGKVYPPELMEKVVAQLSSEPDTRIFLFGGSGHEQQILEGWAEAYPRVCSLAGKRYGFSAELALLNHADAVVTMDSANMHLAAIASAPTISIWGATHSYCGFQAWRQNEADMIELPLACRPCSVYGNKPCSAGTYLCLSGIKPEAIVKKIKEKIEDTNLYG